MIEIMRSKRFIAIITGIFFLFSVAQSYDFSQEQVTAQERIAILPSVSPDISQEELMNLTKEFRTALQNTERFDIQPEIEMDSLFKAKNFSNINECNYALCLADAGKALKVLKVMRIDITKHEDLFTTRIRIIQTTDAAVLFDQVFKHSGNIDSYRNISIPEQIKTIADMGYEQGSSLFHPAIVVAIVLGIIFIIYNSFKSNYIKRGNRRGRSSYSAIKENTLQFESAGKHAFASIYLTIQ